MKDLTDLATYLREVEARYTHEYEQGIVSGDLPTLVQLVRELSEALAEISDSGARLKAQPYFYVIASEALARAERMVKERG